MDKKNVIRNITGIPDTHNFIYKGIFFPIKFDFFKYSSAYFLKNQEDIKSIQNIQLIDEREGENIGLNNNIIESFIDYVQCKDITLTNENVVALNYLSKKYEIDTLTKFTSDYISNHHNELIIEILSIHQNDSTFDTSTYEDILSAHMIEYIDDDRLSNFPVQMLNRVMTKYQLKNKTIDSTDKIIDFLFKCLDKHGREASVLFSDIDFGKLRTKCIQKLLNGYSEIFDFHFINSNLMKTVYEMQNEILFKEEKYQQEQARTIEIIKHQEELYNKQLREQKEKFELQINELQNSLKSLKNEFDKIRSKQIEFLKERQNDKIKSQEMLSEINRLKSEISKQKEEEKIKAENESKLINSKGIGFEFSEENNFSGIFNHLNKITNKSIDYMVDVSSSSTYSSPKNALELRSFRYFTSEDLPGSWICFDFKEHRIILTDYTIRSIRGDPVHYYPKSWVIEGSTNNSSWEILDEQKDCPHLNGSNQTHSFHLKKLIFKEFRYIRMRQTGPNWNNSNNLGFSAIEIFGRYI